MDASFIHFLDRKSIDYLVSRGQLEFVAPNLVLAYSLLEDARLHLQSARLLQTSDTSGAFVMAYDAARKSLAAYLVAGGIRARGGDGGHAVLLSAVRPQLPKYKSALNEFDWMRQLRNDTEYREADRPPASEDDVTEGIEAAAEILAIVSNALTQGSAGPK